MKNNYYLVRHGQSTANEAHIIICKPSVAIAEYGLTEKGRIEAQQTADYLKQNMSNQPIIYTSDFLRAIETAQILTTRFQSEAIVDTRLRERDFGELHGQADTLYNEVWDLDATPSRNSFGVEPLPHLLQRMEELILEVEVTYAHKNIILVSHGDPLMAINTYWQGKATPFMVPDFQNAEVRKLGSPKTEFQPTV